MNPVGSEEAPDSPGRSVDALLQPILDSALLRKAPAERKLLLYLWDRRHHPPSEYSIGIDVFGNKPDFDPKTDSTVRVQVSRLRQRLKEYYEQEGASDPRRIVIRLGEYRAEVCSGAAIRSRTPPSESLPDPKPASRRWTYWLLGVQTIALALLAGYALNRPGVTMPPLHPFWRAFAHDGKPVHIIVPAPQFFRWEGLPYVVRDFGDSSVEQADSSEFLTYLGQKYGKPQTLQWYTVASDTLAASSVARYLQDRRVPANVVDSPAASLELRSTQDTIVFVGRGTMSQLSALSETNFYLRTASVSMVEYTPRAGVVSGNGVLKPESPTRRACVLRGLERSRRSVHQPRSPRTPSRTGAWDEHGTVRFHL